MKTRKTMPRTMHALASMALGLLLAAALAPTAAHADEASESDSLTTRFDRLINPGVPEGYSDDVANPYGKAIGENFLLAEQNELLLYYSFDTNGNKRNQNASWYDTFSIGNGTSLTGKNGFSTSGSYQSTKAYNYVQAIGFDPNGSGRKDHVAYLGYERTGSKNDKGYYVLWVVDAVSGSQSSVLRVRSASDASCNWLEEHNADLYAGSNFFNIVAGDFDGHGGDDLVISISDDTSYGLSQIRYENGQFTEIAQGERGLLHSRYNERFDAAASTWANEAKNKLACDLAVGDYNGDGIDDLAVLSYPNKGHAEIGTKAMSNVEFGMPYLAVSYGSAGSESLIRSADAASYVGTSVQGKPDQTRDTMLCASIAAGDIDNDGKDEIISAGYKGQSAVNGGKGSISTKFGPAFLNSQSLLYGSFAASGNNLQNIEYQTLNANKWTTYDSGVTDKVGPKLAVAAASIDGKANPDRVFISGTMYRYAPDSCTLFTTAGDKSYSPVTLSYFTSHDEYAQSKTVGKSYLAAVAVGNFTDEKQDCEQIAYVVGLQSDDSAHDYSFSVHIASGANYQDNVASGYHLDTGDYIFYNQQFGLNKRTNCTIAAIDRDNDGILASYAGSGYAWSDPQVRAILQASPFFSELNDAENGIRYASGSCETRYSTKTIYSYETSSSNSVSYGAGLTGEIKWFSGRVGYAGSWTRTFMNSVETEVSNTFTAGATDTVVLCRTPVFMYNYNLSFQDESGKQATSTYQIAFPKAPVFEQMTLQRYNEFVPYYNSTIETAAKKQGIDEATYRKAFLQNVGDNLYLGHEGNPYGYYQTDRSDNPGAAPQTKFGDSVGLSTNASATSIDYSFTETEASSLEVANGFSFDASVMGGFSIGGAAAKAGVYVSLEYMQGHSTTTTNGTGTSFGGTVMGLDGATMEADGLDPDAWSFKWRLATWDSNLKAGKLDDAGFVPIVGYALSSVESPAAAVNNLDVRFSRETGSDNLRFDLSWGCGDIADSKRPETAGYCVYLYDNARETYLLLAKIDDAQTTAYTYETAFDGRERYTFKVTSWAEATPTAPACESTPRFATRYLSADSPGPIDTERPGSSADSAKDNEAGSVIETERTYGLRTMSSASAGAPVVASEATNQEGDATGAASEPASQSSDVSAAADMQADRADTEDADANAKMATATSENDQAQADAPQSQDGGINVGYIAGFLALALALLGLALIILRATQSKRS